MKHLLMGKINLKVNQLSTHCNPNDRICLPTHEHTEIQKYG